jgi:hypothetical protein
VTTPSQRKYAHICHDVVYFPLVEKNKQLGTLRKNKITPKFLPVKEDTVPTLNEVMKSGIDTNV